MSRQRDDKAKRSWDRGTGTAEGKALAQAVANRITEVRQQRGLTQDELAQRMGTTVFAISRNETGANGIRIGKLADYAAALECPVKDLIPAERDWRPLAGQAKSDIKAAIAFHAKRASELQTLLGKG